MNSGQVKIRIDVDKDFQSVCQGNVIALVRREGSDPIFGALVQHKNCEQVNVYGRGVVLRFPWTEFHNGILRRCHRGGFVRYFMSEYYIFRNRPLEEFKLHLSILNKDLPAPNLLGVCWSRCGMLYAGALATEEMNGVDLDAWLRSHCNEAEEGESMLIQCGQLVRRYHDAGVYHGDLQLKNIFIHDGMPVLLDFDNATIGKPLNHLYRACNLLRLRRSFNRMGHGRRTFDTLIIGYGAIILPKWLSVLYGVRGFFSDMMRVRKKDYPRTR